MGTFSLLKRALFITTCALSIAVMPEYFSGTSTSFVPNAEARPNNGGFRGPAQNKRPVTRPTTRPVTRPTQRPMTRPRPTIRPRPSMRPRPSVRPNRPISRPRPSRPNNSFNRPVTRPRPTRPTKPFVIPRPRPNRPALVKPLRPNKPVRPAPDQSRPDFVKPLRPNKPNRPAPDWNRPDLIKPLRPVKPGRPPWWRPPTWRPPYWAPPFYRPPHWYWGDHFWHKRWGWYYSDYLFDRTVVFIDRRPDDCEETYFEGERLLYCDGILYRPSYHKDKRIYEIIDPEENTEANVDTTLPSTQQEEVQTTQTIEVSDGTVLKLQIPRMSGPYVTKVQSALKNDGYVIDDKDGVFGTGTNLAIKAFQIQNSLAPSGDVDSITAQKLGL